jgi:hypothetical protein
MNMRYTEFRDQIQAELRQHPDGLTWVELKTRLILPYERPCQTWVRELEKDIRLTRVKGTGRAYLWKIHPE